MDRFSVPGQRIIQKWQGKTPVSKLAKQMGISDAAIRKHCEKEGIELPGNDHWQAVRRKGGL